MKHSTLYCFLLWLCISCSKTSTPLPSVIPPVDTLPAQYGVPFTGVPDSRDVAIYQVNMRVFSPGNFQSVLARLDSIKALGINVIYLMPIYPVGQLNAVNSPYCIKDYKSINTEFGNLQDLRVLVAAAHSRNMAVILDWVANHTAWDNTWMTNKSWYLQDINGNIVSPLGTGWLDVAQLNFNSAPMRLAMINAMKYWVYTANTDGFRCDYADGPPVSFWQQAIDSLRNIKTHKLLMMAEGSRSDNFSTGFDFNFGFNFYGNLKSVINNNKSALLIDTVNENEYAGITNEYQRVVRYTSNHDIDGSDGTPMQLFGGRNGSMASFVVAAYMKSVPMMYTGQEVGTPVRLVFPFTTTKVDWSINPDYTAEYKKILLFRNSSQALRQGTLTAYSSANVCAFTKQLGLEQVLVLVNLRNSTTSYSIPAQLANTTWTDAFTGSSVLLTTQVSLSPYNYIVLKK